MQYFNQVYSKLDTYPRFQASRLWLKTNLRPWAEFFNRTLVSRPPTSAEALVRLNHNLPYFKANYALITLLVSMVFVLSNWLFLGSVIVLTAIFVYVAGYGGEQADAVMLVGVSLRKRDAYIALGVVGFILLWISNAWGILVSTCFVGGILCLSHALFMEKGVVTEFASNV